LVLSGTVLVPVDTHGARVTHLTIRSKAVGQPLGVNVVVPGSASARPPLLVFLHGRGGSESSFSGDDAMLRALAKLGPRAPIIAFPDGSDHSYWHDRAGGRWSTYVMREVIPRVLHDFHANPRRVAIGGISMGGFGAYDLALHHPGRFCAVGGHSPALWLRGADTAPGAFDDAADFARNDVIGSVRHDPGAFGGIPVWNDAGSSDPFLSGDVAFVGALRSGREPLTVERWPGGHNNSYWDSHWISYLGFYTRELAACKR
jgi:S-formylglutathione hydrolase FrmB